MSDVNEVKNTASSRSSIDQTATKSLAEKTDRTKYISTVIALASLAATAYSFFFLNVQVRHDFKGTLYWVSVQDGSDTPLVTGEFLMVNRGNQYEVLRYVSFLLASDEECNDNFEIGERAGPLTFKPGESSVLTLSAHISANDRDNIKKTFKERQRAYLCGYFNVLGADGSPTARFYKFGLIHTEEGELEGPFESAKADHGLVDLLENSSGDKVGRH
jgi:hypothetical protein